MRKVILTAAAMLATPAFAQEPAPPKLLVVISVDQFSADLFDEYRPHFTAGLARLAQGTVFRNGYQSHATTQTCPGHATLLTGSRPARTGIIANQWFNFTAPRADKQVYCAEDESVGGTTHENYRVSPIHLRTPTLGELMKARWPRSRSVAVAGKDRSAIMMGGHRLDQRWYWDDGAFVTDLKGAAAPRSVARANAAVKQAIAAPRAPLQPPPVCALKSREITLEGSGRTVGAGRFGRAAGDEDGFHDSPEFDAATLALAAGLVQDMKLGAGPAPDLLAISLSATDYVGHRYGPGGQEMCLQLLSLDRDLAGFFAVLDGAGIDYAVALSADHGGQDAPERLRLQGIAAERIAANLSVDVIGGAIAREIGLKTSPLVAYGSNVYVDRSLPSDVRARVLALALAAYRAHPQVEAAFSAAELKAVPSPSSTPDRWTLAERARASFDPDRSGDITVLLKPYVTPVRDTKDTAATHGAPWDYDRGVPILFWRRGMNASDREQAVETVDIMPTLAAAIGLSIDPASIDGKCLMGIQAIACPAR